MLRRIDLFDPGVVAGGELGQARAVFIGLVILAFEIKA